MQRYCEWAILAALLLLAAAADAPAGPLSECYAISASRVEVGPCLDRKGAEADADPAAMVRAVRDGMRDLDRVTGRTDADSVFEQTRELKAASRLRIEEGNLLLENANGGTRLTFER